jgi:hypothetical protein
VLIDAGHFVWEEAPTEYAAVILDAITSNGSVTGSTKTRKEKKPR